MKRRKFTKKEREQIFVLLRSGLPIWKVANIMKCSEYDIVFAKYGNTK